MMSIHEQIIAFLDGEITSEAEAAELMHVLAVSPEKRAILVESARMGRAFSTMGSTLAPPAAADMAILAGIANIDTGFPSPNAPVPSATDPTARDFTRRPYLLATAAFLLVGLGLVAGYFLGGDRSTAGATAPQQQQRQRVASSPLPLTANRSSDDREVLLLRDSLATVRNEIAQLRKRPAATPARTVTRYIDRYVDRSINREANVSTRETVSSQGDDSTSGPVYNRTNTLSRIEARNFAPPPGRISSPDTNQARVTSSNASKIPLADAADEPTSARRWHIGIRNNIRTSLPKIYGLATRQNILTDREVQGGMRFDEGFLGLRTPVQVGAAFGGTRFSQIFQIHEGGASVSTLIEQTPDLLYARAWVAPQILSSNAWGASLEIGGGGTEVGPFVSLGLDAEYRPIDLISVHGGASSWLLWSGTGLQTSLSANLNGYMGASYWF